MTEPDWKEIDLYLADCHAATAEYDGTLKSTSKSRRRRLQKICENAAYMIEGSMNVPRPRGEEPVLRRLREAAKDD